MSIAFTGLGFLRNRKHDRVLCISITLTENFNLAVSILRCTAITVLFRSNYLEHTEYSGINTQQILFYCVPFPVLEPNPKVLFPPRVTGHSYEISGVYFFRIVSLCVKRKDISSQKENTNRIFVCKKHTNISHLKETQRIFLSMCPVTVILLRNMKAWHNWKWKS
jgi:hypothetical protein